MYVILRTKFKVIHFFTYIFIFFLHPYLSCAEDPLPSWNEGEAKKAILEFVKEVTDSDGKNFIPVEERIATFDQDGTLWVEKPLYTQLVFAIDRLKAIAPLHPEWNDQQLLSLLDGNKKKLNSLTEADVEAIVSRTHSEMTIEAFQDTVRLWIDQTINPHFQKKYTELVYQPMLEVIQLLNDNAFKTYIVSGGGQEFMRAYAEKVYGIPPERIIGTAGKLKYDYQNGKPVLLKLPVILLIDDKKGKPETISLFIGRKPVAAFGNSDGDREMLEWTQAGKGKRFELLVHHDDEEREFTYGKDSKIGTFSESLMYEAKKKGWVVVSMKRDWKIIFPWQKPVSNQQ